MGNLCFLFKVPETDSCTFSGSIEAGADNGKFCV